MKKPFNQASYLAQVRRLKILAQKALAEYPIRVKSIHFIQHGENATFRVQAAHGQTFLLRVHRQGYHSKSAIIEEMRWLRRLVRDGFFVPNPVLSNGRRLVETVETADTGSRNCTVLEWVHGRFIGKSVKPRHMFEVGRLLAQFHNHTSNNKVIHRRYWTAEGLVGETPKFGALNQVKALSTSQRKVLLEARKTVFTKLRKYEKKYPNRQGLIHADLHFGNFLSSGGRLGAIDFDDCGYGFFVYDLVIPYISLQRVLGTRKKSVLLEYKNALIEGYKTERKWTNEDEALFPYLVAARRIMMIGWLNSRSDNPRLRRHLKGAFKEVVRYLKELE